MTDKITHFRRINEPRAMRVLEQLGHIEKSAASMRIEAAEVGMMLTPVIATIKRMRRADAEEQKVWGQPGPTPGLDATLKANEQVRELTGITQPIARETESLDALSTQQLIDRMIACGAILASRRA